MRRDLVHTSGPQGIYSETVDDRGPWRYTEISGEGKISRFTCYTFDAEAGTWQVHDNECEGMLSLTDYTNELTPRQARVEITALREKHGVTNAPMALPLPG